MADDEILAARIRALVGDAPDVTDMKTFGGLAFPGRASGEGGVKVRIDPGTAYARSLPTGPLR